VATDKRWMWLGKYPPSGERWLRISGGSGQENLHRLAIGGYEEAVATKKRWLRRSGGRG